MSFRFVTLQYREARPSSTAGTVYLVPNNWDDYSFKTLFSVFLVSGIGESIELGSVKIGHSGQAHGWTLESMPREFSELPEGWFSLGQSPEYYKAIMALSADSRRSYLSSLKDVIFDSAALQRASGERVFNDSLTRNVSTSTINGQFSRILSGLASLTDFHFKFARQMSERQSAVDLDFKVKESSKPSTNVHVIIGRNGVGKTTILNDLITAAIDPSSPSRGTGRLYENLGDLGLTELAPDYFSGVVSVSFSAFDPFDPPPDRSDVGHGPNYSYVGMKKNRAGLQESRGPLPPKSSTELAEDLISSVAACLSQPERRERWRRAVRRLESDANFAEMELERIIDHPDEASPSSRSLLGSLARRMSSGHAIVLLIVSRLVEKVEEKTLVLMDEPESHLHPPLLSAFTRALSELLHDRNGVAIIATHSPVVLQEVPQSCVWKLSRARLEGRSDRPEIETFGENVGTLTREVFGLEVSKSGFHELLASEVFEGKSYDAIVNEYNNQLGTEAKAILLAMIRDRDTQPQG